MAKWMLAMALSGALSNAVLAASQAELQADSFIKIYSLCMTHAMDFKPLREKLKKVPMLESDKAQMLIGQAVDAWQVPDKQGQFVLALAKDKDLCMVFALKADTERVKTLFSQVAGQPTPPFIVTQREGQSGPSRLANGRQLLAYQWSLPDQPRKLLFMLSTAPASSQSVAAQATVSVGRD